MTAVKDPMRQMTRDERSAQYHADFQYFRDHADELFACYPEEFIGVLDGEVVLHSLSLETFAADLTAMGAVGARVAIEQATRTPAIQIPTVWIL